MGKPRLEREQPDAARLLGTLASALTACERAGLAVRLRHGIAETSHGYVLPVSGEWVARTRLYAPFAPASDTDDD